MLGPDFEYQPRMAEHIYNEVTKGLFNYYVLGAGVNSGKTNISKLLYNEILKQRPSCKILHIAWNQNFLKEQTFQSFNGNKPYKRNFTLGHIGEGAQVEITIHQELRNYLKNYSLNVDLLVVDEAWHSNILYYGQDILRKLGNPKVLILSGSIGQFNRWNFENPSDKCLIIPLAVNELLEKGVHNSVDCSLIVARNEVEAINEAFKLRRKGRYVKGSILVTCTSQNQAERIYEALRRKKINVAVSTSESDPESQFIEQFKSGDITALIVVNRAVAGLNVPNAELLINFRKIRKTNIELIGQILGRLYRRSSTEKTKLFVSVTNEENYSEELNNLRKVINLNKKEELLNFIS